MCTTPISMVVGGAAFSRCSLRWRCKYDQTASFVLLLSTVRATRRQNRTRTHAAMTDGASTAPPSKIPSSSEFLESLWPPRHFAHLSTSYIRTYGRNSYLHKKKKTAFQPYSFFTNVKEPRGDKEIVPVRTYAFALAYYYSTYEILPLHTLVLT